MLYVVGVKGDIDEKRCFIRRKHIQFKARVQNPTLCRLKIHTRLWDRLAAHTMKESKGYSRDGFSTVQKTVD